MRMLLSLLILAAVACAQPRIQGSATTLSVANSPETMNRWVAVGMSALLPGSGEYAMGKTTRARWFLATDVMLWMSLWGSLEWQDRTLRNVHEYAVRYAGVNGQLSDDPDFLQKIADFRSRETDPTSSVNPEPGQSYDLDQLRAGQKMDAEFPTSASYQWNWGSLDDPQTQVRMQRYQDRLSQWRSARITSQALMGGLVLNRLISVADVLILGRRATGLRMGVAPTPEGQMQVVFAGSF
jgi:hypothetical protein